MSLSERLQAMVQLWDFLTRDGDEIRSPDWHPSAEKQSFLTQDQLRSHLRSSEPRPSKTRGRCRRPRVGAQFWDCARQGLDSFLSDLDCLVLLAGVHRIYFEFHRMLSKGFPFGVYYEVEGLNLRWPGLISAVITFFVTRAKVRLDLTAEYDRKLRSERLDAYRDLFKSLKPLARYSPESPLTYQIIRNTSEELRDWYFDTGGIYLSKESRTPYF
jgi:hypothetical protein